MGSKNYKLAKLDDLELLKLFIELGEIFETDLKEVTVSVLGVAGTTYNLDEIRTHSGRFSIDSVRASFPIKGDQNCSVSLKRNVIDNNIFFPVMLSFTPPSSFDSSFPENIEYFQKASNLFNSLVDVDDKVSVKNSGAGFTRAIQSLTAQHQMMLENLDQKLRDLEDKRSKMVSDFEVEKKKEIEKIDEEKAAVAEERRLLQLDSPRAERRRILEDFTKNAGHLAEDVSLGNQFIMVRFAVFAAAMVSGVLFAFIALSSIYSISGGSIKIFGFDFYVSTQSDLTQSYVMMGFLAFKSAISTAISIGSFLLGINWLKSLQNEEARNARMVSRFKRDLIRASWIIETVQEIRGSDGQGEIPDVWLDRATNGMFDNYGSEISQDGNDALKTLLSNSSKLSVGPDGITAEMGSKGAKNLAGEL
jgi:hypothetical protein